MLMCFELFSWVTLADLTGGHTCSGRRGPCPKSPGGPTGGVLSRPIKCHVTTTKRKTCIANKSSAVDEIGAIWQQYRHGPKIGRRGPFFSGGEELGPHLTQCGRSRGIPHAKFYLGPSNRLATIYQHHRQTDSTDGTGQTAVR